MSRNRDFSALWRACCALLFTLFLSACGGSSGGGGNGGDNGTDGAPAQEPDQEAAVCETGDAVSVPDGCGRLFVGFSDLDGDFVRYRVAITSLQLLREDGTPVELLPVENTVDLAQYRDLAELVTAATLPVDIYTSAEITLDYTDADIRVDVDGVARRARVLHPDGRRVRAVTLVLDLDPLNRPLAAPELPPLLQLDFSLTASHIVDTLPTPPEVELYPVATAEVDPLQLKEFRLRGPLIGVDAGELSYRIALRPFDGDAGRQGGVDIFIDGDTEWQIDGEAFFSSTGLGALAELPADTATLAFGRFDGATRRFTARLVYAGDSVPGISLDALEGHVLARDGNLLTLIGTRLIRIDGSVVFDDDRRLLLPTDARVVKPGFRLEQQTAAAVSVGQRITALGLWDEEQLLLDAVEVRLLPTALDATLNSRAGDQLDVTTLAFGNRDSLLFDYTGTGSDETLDADPLDYQVDAQSLVLDSPALDALVVNAPLRISGYAAPFGDAPPDFDAEAIEDFVDGGAQLLVTWAGDGSADALLALDATGLRPNLGPGLLGSEFFIRRGAVFTNLLDLPQAPLLQPLVEGGLFALVEGDFITLYSDFGDFATDLDRRMVAGALVKILHAEGGYRSGATSMSVQRLEVVLSD